MKRFLIPLLSLLILIIPLSAMADPFSDVPSEHWAYDAVNMLEEKGLVEGYPDGLFKGDRPVTRYEMAMVVARVIAKLEQVQASIPQMPDLSVYATKEDLEVINKLAKEFKGELDGLGVRVANIEDSLGRISSRVEELERVFVTGDITSVASTVGYTKYNVLGSPSTDYIAYEDYGGYLLTEGAAVTTRLNLDVGVNIDEHVTAGGTFTGFSAFGDADVAYSWGVLPPYNAAGISAFNANDNIYNVGVNYQANLNKLWFKTDGDWKIDGTFGEYQPEKISSLIYYGIVAPAYWGPATMPVNGINIKGTLYENYKFELIEADDLTWLDYGPLPLYSGYNPFDLYTSDYYKFNGFHNRMYGALGGYENDRLDFDATYLRIYEDYASNPGIDMIPRDEILFGIRGSYKILEEDKLKLFGEFNQSWFDYNLLDSAEPRRSGNLLVLGGEGTWESLDYKAQFLRIEGNYEPFNFHKIFEFMSTECCNIGESVYIPSLYRPNRIGFNMNLQYNFAEEKGAIFGGLTYASQIDPTLDTDPVTTIGSSYGFQDHSFLNNSTDKGKEFFYDIGGSYQITDKAYVEGHYFGFNFKRDYATYKHDQTRHYLHVAGSYNITDEFKVTGLYEMVKVTGIDDNGFDTDGLLHIPGVSMSYDFSENASVGVDYRCYNGDSNSNSEPVVNYNANRVSTWMKLAF